MITDLPDIWSHKLESNYSNIYDFSAAFTGFVEWALVVGSIVGVVYIVCLGAKALFQYIVSKVSGN